MNINLKLQLCCFQKDSLGIAFSSKLLGFGDHTYCHDLKRPDGEQNPADWRHNPSLTPVQLMRGHRWLNDAAILNRVFNDLLSWTLAQILVYSLVLVSLNVDLDRFW